MAYILVGFSCGAIGSMIYGGLKGGWFGILLALLVLGHALITREGR